MTVDDGTTLDSRQPITGDPGCRVTHSSLAGSLLWWTTAASLVLPILESAGTDAFAMVLGNRSVFEVRADQTLGRTTLRKFLPGDTTTIDLVRTSMSEPLPDGYSKASVMTNWDNTVMGTIGFTRGTGGARWRFLNGNEYYLKEAGPSIGATVLIDTTDTLLGDPNLIGTELLSSQFENLEQRRLFSQDIVLVLPHTHRVEQLVRGYADWVRAARPVDKTFRPPPTRLNDPSAVPSSRASAKPVPIKAEFGVTGLLEQGSWADPSNLEAARSLLQSRYDVKIGIWDLVENPTLRQTLLHPVEPTPPPAAPAPVPPAAARRAERTKAKKEAEREAAQAALSQIRRSCGPLRDLGWEIGRPSVRWFGRLPLTKPVSRWPGDEPFPLVQLELAIEKRHCSVSAFTILYNQVNINEFIESHPAQLSAISGTRTGALDRRARPEIWRIDGGWADSIDWNARIKELASCTEPWTEFFAPLVDRCMRVQQERAAQRGDGENVVATLRLEVGLDPRTGRPSVVIAPPDHDPGWEYLYLASELARGLKAHADALGALESGGVTIGPPVPNPTQTLRDFNQEVSAIVSRAVAALDPDRMTKALGPPGEPGDETEIRGVAVHLADGYGQMIDWARRVRAAGVPAQWRPVFWALSNFVALPLKQFQDFSDELTRTTGEVVKDIRAGRKQTKAIMLSLSLSIDDAAVADFNEALGSVNIH